MPESIQDGFLLIDKPAGMTSHDVIDHLRRVLKTRRIGHAGTLDPFATGLLLVGVGPKTKELEEEIKNIQNTYKNAVSVYEKLLDLKSKIEDTEKFDERMANIFTFLSQRIIFIHSCKNVFFRTKRRFSSKRTFSYVLRQKNKDQLIGIAKNPKEIQTKLGKGA